MIQKPPYNRKIVPAVLSSGILLIVLLLAYGEPSSQTNMSNLSHRGIDDLKTGILVPLYRHPGSSWDELIQVKHTHQSVPIIAIVNPSNGPGSGALNYITGIEKLHSAGIPVLGYVYTRYGDRNSSEITNDIDAYKKWYSVDGIFFDEMSHVPGKENYYRYLNNYTKSIGLGFTVGNPGKDTSPSYVGTVDNIVIYEDSGLPPIGLLGGWHTTYPKSNFSILPYGVDKINETYVKKISNNVGFVYITDQTLPNPWYSLATYIDQLGSFVELTNHETNSSALSNNSKNTVVIPDRLG